MLCSTQDMAGDPFGLLMRQRIVFLGGEVCSGSVCKGIHHMHCAAMHGAAFFMLDSPFWQVNDFTADAIISQLLLLDAQVHTTGWLLREWPATCRWPSALGCQR